MIRRTIKRYSNNPDQKLNLPMASDCNLKKNKETASQEQVRTFQEIIGSLLYIVRYTRLKISVAVNILSQFTVNPSVEHLDCLNQIISPLNATKEAKLVVKPTNNKELMIYSDADWASAKTDRKSISGYAIYLGSTLVVWNSKRQQCVALSTMEAEMIALCKGLKTAKWIQ